MSGKITNMSMTYKQWEYNAHGTGFVPCYKSQRWLQFSDTYDAGTGLVDVDVMTINEDNTSRKICTLCINIHDLKAELDKIKPSKIL